MPDVQEAPPGPKVAEGAPTKARRYLCEGRLHVTHVSPGTIAAVCRGDGEIYRLGFRNSSWYCDCPARTRQCAHLRALRLVTDRPNS